MEELEALITSVGCPSICRMFLPRREVRGGEVWALWGGVVRGSERQGSVVRSG